MLGQRQSTRVTRSNTKDDVAYRHKCFKGARNTGKEGSMSLCSPTLEKVKDHGNVNQSCLDKTENDGKILYERKAIDVPVTAHRTKNANNSVNTPIPYSTVKINDYRLKCLKNNMDTPIPQSNLKIKDKDKENAVQSGYSLAGNANIDKGITMSDSLMKRKDKGRAVAVPLEYPSINNVKSNIGEAHVPLKGVIIKERGETATGSSHVDLPRKDDGKAVLTPNSVINRKDKGKAIAVTLDNPSMKYMKSNMVEGRVPLKGVVIKDRGETVSGSSCVDPVQKDEGKAVATPINYRTLEKKDKRSSCPPLLRATSNRFFSLSLSFSICVYVCVSLNILTDRDYLYDLWLSRNETVGAKDIIQFKPQTEPPPNKKVCLTSIYCSHILTPFQNSIVWR